MRRDSSRQLWEFLFIENVQFDYFQRIYTSTLALILSLALSLPYKHTPKLSSSSSSSNVIISYNIISNLNTFYIASSISNERIACCRLCLLFFNFLFILKLLRFPEKVLTFNMCRANMLKANFDASDDQLAGIKNCKPLKSMERSDSVGF